MDDRGAFPKAVAAIFAVMERDPALAVRQADALRTNGSLPEYWRDYMVGCALLNWERIPDARPWLVSALDGLARADLPVVWRLHCQRALQAQAALSAVSTATEPWEDLIRQYLECGEDLEAGRTAVYLARAWHSKRESRDVEQVVKQWLPLFAAPEHSGDAGRLLRVRGAARVAQGDYAAARPDLERAIALFSRTGAAIEVARCEMELAWLELACDQLSEASALLKRAAAVFDAADLPVQRAFASLNLSILVRLQGDFASALFYCSQARELFAAMDRSIDIGSCELEFGAIHEQIGHWEAANGHYMLALDMYETSAAPGRVLMCYLNLAHVALLHGNNDLAGSWLDLFERHPSASQFQMLNGVLHRHRAHLLVNHDDLAAASEAFDLAAATFTASGDHGRAAQCRLDRAWLDLEHDLAAHSHEARLSRCAADLGEQPIHRWRALDGLATYYEASGRPDAALEQYRQASEIVFQMRRQLASEHLSSRLFNQAAAMYFRALNCAARLDRPLDLVLLAEHQRALTLQRLLFAPPARRADDPAAARLLAAVSALNHELYGAGNNPQIRQRLNETLSRYTALISQNRHRAPAPLQPEYRLDIASIQAHFQSIHQDDWTVACYLWAGSDWLMVMITPEAVSWQCLNWDDEAGEKLQLICDAASRRYVYLDGDFHSGVTVQRWEILGYLGGLLLPPMVQDRLSDRHRLYLVPSGSLHALPWAALRIAGSWLCERAILQTIPSLSLLDFRLPAPPVRRALLVGCDDFGGRYAPLPHVAAELKALELKYRDHCEVDVVPRCSVEQLLASAGGESRTYDVIHLATHGKVLSSQGLAAHLALADGELWLDTIISVKVDGACVILSACDGAVAEVLPGEEQLSLPAAWLVAGASGVVASLWPTLDGDATWLFEEFHAMLRAGYDGGLALAHAQRRYIEQGRSPLQWGSFVYTSRRAAAPSERPDLNPDRSPDLAG